MESARGAVGAMRCARCRAEIAGEVADHRCAGQWPIGGAACPHTRLSEVQREHRALVAQNVPDDAAWRQAEERVAQYWSAPDPAVEYAVACLERLTNDQRAAVLARVKGEAK